MTNRHILLTKVNYLLHVAYLDVSSRLPCSSSVQMTLATSLAYPCLVGSIFLLEGIQEWFFGSTGAVPVRILLLLLAMLLFVQMPLVFIGSFYGFKREQPPQVRHCSKTKASTGITLLGYTVLYCTIPCSAVQCCTLHGTACFTVQGCTVPYTLQYGTRCLIISKRSCPLWLERHVCARNLSGPIRHTVPYSTVQFGELRWAVQFLIWFRLLHGTVCYRVPYIL